MRIKQSFISSLEGLPLDQAEALVKDQGLKLLALDEGTAVSQILRPDTIIAWLDDSGKIGIAVAGDIDQVVDDG